MYKHLTKHEHYYINRILSSRKSISDIAILMEVKIIEPT